MHADADSSFAARASPDEPAPPLVSSTTGFAPSAASSSASADAIRCSTVPSASPASIATTCPSIEDRIERTDSASRTTARPGPDSVGRMRSSVDRVSMPTMPSGSSPTFRWNSRTARSVSGPNSPSSLPASNPRPFSFRWSALTSSPRWNGEWR